MGNLGLKRISKLTRLRRVNLSYSNVSDDGVMYLENAASIRSSRWTRGWSPTRASVTSPS